MRAQFDGDANLPAGEHEVALSTEHAASSYGIPVLVVVKTGEAVDKFSWVTGWRLVEASEQEKAALRNGGYALVRKQEARNGD
jgi:hypothetical protein